MKIHCLKMLLPFLELQKVSHLRKKIFLWELLAGENSLSGALNSQQAQSCLSTLQSPIPVGFSSACVGFKS